MMVKTLEVFFDQTLVGVFQQDKHGRNTFTYNKEYLNNPKAYPISQIMPLKAEPFTHNVCHAFFAGVLPEQNQRRLVARILGISAENDYSLLEKIGGECAGAITFQPPGTLLNEQKYKYKEISDKELEEIITILPKRPLLAGERGIRLSLAGVQDKIPLAIFDNKKFLPLDGAPSTHILKPSILGYEFNTVTNEAFCLKLAKLVGINVVECEIGSTSSHQYLLVKRYDRELMQDGHLKRLHQEDFCQALGIPPEQKYQNEGGPSFASCFELIRRCSSNQISDITKLLDSIIFNYIIGNCDAHGKNFSLLYNGKSTKIAPLYDLLSTVIYPELENKMAMKIGKEYNIYKINKECFISFAKEAELNKTIVLEKIISLCDLVNKYLYKIEIDDKNLNKLQMLLGTRTENIKNIFSNMI